MREYSFDVAVSTHDNLKEKVLTHHWTRVQVYADSWHRARLIAIEMASCGGWMVTAIEYVE